MKDDYSMVNVTLEVCFCIENLSVEKLRVNNGDFRCLGLGKYAHICS